MFSNDNIGDKILQMRFVTSLNCLIEMISLHNYSEKYLLLLW